MTEPLGEQTEVRCVLMRGGTSKALFFHEADVPPPGAARDRLLKRAMGTPDVLQIDGMGGSRLVTSKIAIIKKSGR
ncbi:MAG: PrpF protein, partial [Comamonadaceae bacterium]